MAFSENRTRTQMVADSASTAGTQTTTGDPVMRVANPKLANKFDYALSSPSRITDNALDRIGVSKYLPSPFAIGRRLGAADPGYIHDYAGVASGNWRNRHFRAKFETSTGKFARANRSQTERLARAWKKGDTDKYNEIMRKVKDKVLKKVADQEMVQQPLFASMSSNFDRARGLTSTWRRNGAGGGYAGTAVGPTDTYELGATGALG